MLITAVRENRKRSYCVLERLHKFHTGVFLLPGYLTGQKHHRHAPDQISEDTQHTLRAHVRRKRFKNTLLH